VRRLATATWFLSLAVFVGGLLYFASLLLGMLFCAPSDPTYIIIMLVDFWGFPVLAGAAIVVGRTFLRRNRYVGAIACSAIPWLHVIVYLLLLRVPWECV
jgi:hypothetical protein